MAKSPLDVRLYRSSVKGRRPQAADMAYGDLAVNYNHEDPALIIKGDDNTLIEFRPGAGVSVGAVAPTAAKDGDLWWDTTSARLFVRYTAGTPAVSVWVDASPAAVPPTMTNVLTYRGTADPTVAVPAGRTPTVGDVYVASKAGTAEASWTGLAGQAVSLHELLIWDGTEWDGAGVASGGGAGGGAATGGGGGGSFREVDITAAMPPGYTPAIGDFIEVHRAGALHADWGTVDPQAVVGSVLIYDGHRWMLLNTAVPDASASVKGVVQLADAAAITVGTAGLVVDAAQLKEAVTTGVVTFKGALDFTAAFPGPSLPAAGQLYVSSKAGLADGGYTGLGGKPVSEGELIVYDGTNWSGGAPVYEGTLSKSLRNAEHLSPISAGATKGAIEEQLRTRVDLSRPAPFILNGGMILIHNASPMHTDWQGILPSDAKQGDLYINCGMDGYKKLYPSSGAAGAVSDATTSAKGIVQLADAAAITAGTAGRVVDAAQLKAHIPPDATTTDKGIVQIATPTDLRNGTRNHVVDAAAFKALVPVVHTATDTAKGIVQLADAAAITAGTAGRVVDAAQLKAAVGAGATGSGSVPDATTSAKGVVQLADAAAITAGTAGRVVDAAQLKAHVPQVANASSSLKGIVRLARPADFTGGYVGASDDCAITPRTLLRNGPTASGTEIGFVQLANYDIHTRSFTGNGAVTSDMLKDWFHDYMRNLQVHATKLEAARAGLGLGDLYKKADGTVMVV